MVAEPVRIDLDEEFPHLSAAPIAEAMIEWRVGGTNIFDPAAMEQSIRDQLPGSPKLDVLDRFYRQRSFDLDELAELGEEDARRLSRRVRYEAKVEESQVLARFEANAFSVIRLAPYDDWSQLRDAAIRLWPVYRSLYGPGSVRQIRLRYLNLVPLETIAEANELLQKPIEFPGDWSLPIDRFLERDTFDVPGHPYTLSMVRASTDPQSRSLRGPDGERAAPGPGLVIDLDVRTTRKTLPTEYDLDDRTLLEMRWLKNRAFFATFRSEAIERFR